MFTGYTWKIGSNSLLLLNRNISFIGISSFRQGCFFSSIESTKFPVHSKTFGINTNHCCFFRTNNTCYADETFKLAIELLKTRKAVNDFISELSDEQKRLIYLKLHSDIGIDQHHLLSKFGRPSTFVDEHEESISKQSANSLDQLKSSESEEESSTNIDTPASGSDLFAVGLKNALPFVGFGFLDNLIMIVAGDYIDFTIGTALGISTLAAAALGNTISDIAGIGSAWYVEHFAEKFGIYNPELTAFQTNSWRVRWSINIGRALGVTIGCFLGMIPLLWLPNNKEISSSESVK